MTVRPWRLENYDLRENPSDGSVSVPVSAVEAQLEEARLESFDRGYKAGWEDATTAHHGDQSHITAEFARNLQDMSFTYHEARQALMRDAEALFRGMVDVFLPKILPVAVAANVLERLDSAMEQATNTTVEIKISPENVNRLTEMVDGATTPPLRIIPEPSLGPGQACLRFGDTEERVDLAATLTEVEAIVNDLFAPETPQEDMQDAG